MKKLLGIFFILSVIIYLLSSKGATPYDYFTRLADAFLRGRVYLTQNPPWLNELITLAPNKYAFVNPPMPAILAMPFVLFFPNSFEQQYLAHILGAGIVVLTTYLAHQITKSKKIAVWSGILTGFGTILFYMSSAGSVWYLGQITGSLFLTAAIVESLGKKRPFLIGVLFSFALLSRLQILFALPFFIGILIEKRNFRKIVPLLLGGLIFVIIYAGYNYLRFGSPFQTGYALLPGIFDEPWFNKGQFHVSYIINHLRIIFTALPKYSKTFPHIYPSWAGLAIWITTPAFIYALWSPLKDRITILSLAAILGIGLINFSYGSTGFSQFGYRYAMDFYPFLTLLTIKGVNKSGLKWHHWLLLILGVIVNLWGVIWINKLNFVFF